MRLVRFFFMGVILVWTAAKMVEGAKLVDLCKHVFFVGGSRFKRIIFPLNDGRNTKSTLEGLGITASLDKSPTLAFWREWGIGWLVVFDFHIGAHFWLEKVTEMGPGFLAKESDTLQGTNISHLGKRNIIGSKVPAGRGYVSFEEGTSLWYFVDFREVICLCLGNRKRVVFRNPSWYAWFMPGVQDHLTTLPGGLGCGGQKVRREGGEEGHFLVNG